MKNTRTWFPVISPHRRVRSVCGRMRLSVGSCLLAFVLACNVAAEIIHKVVKEKDQVTLPCPRPVQVKVTWSRERDGNRVDILRTEGDGDTRHNDPGKRFSSQADKSLHSKRVNLSDSGRYFCNNEPAVDLTVIPSGTTRLDAVAGTNVKLNCSSNVTWSGGPTLTKQNRGTNTTFSQNNRLRYSAEEKTWTVTEVQPDDAGLYHCDGNPPVYLTVINDEQSETAAVLMLGVLLPLLLIIIFIILFLTWRCRIKRRRSGEQSVEMIYAEISDESVFEPMQGGSNQHDHTYAIIHDVPALGNRTVAPQPLYSLINKL